MISNKSNSRRYLLIGKLRTADNDFGDGLSFGLGCAFSAMRLAKLAMILDWRYRLIKAYCE